MQKGIKQHVVRKPWEVVVLLRVTTIRRMEAAWGATRAVPGGRRQREDTAQHKAPYGKADNRCRSSCLNLLLGEVCYCFRKILPEKEAFQGLSRLGQG